MKKTAFKTLVLIFVMHAIALSTNGQDPQKAKMSPDGRGYLEYLPADYANTTEQYPAIIFLHGSGERGTGSPTDLAKVTANGPPKHIKNGHKMCFTVNGKQECFIVLSPQTNEWSWKYDVVPFVKYALAAYRIDPTRVYVTGLSMGGEGTWFAAAMEDNAPNLFAAIAPMCGRAAVSDGTSVANKRLAVWAFHGDADASIPLAAGQRPITGMTNANANPAPIFTIYPGGGHSTAWDRGYRTDHTYHNPNVYEWFLSQRLPASITLPNIIPTVNAGADQTIELPASQATLTATANDTGGSIASYQWTKTAGPAVTMTNANTATLSLSNVTTAGLYTFSLTVTDNQGATATDVANVVVNPLPGTNQAPTVNGGADQNLNLPISQVVLTANANDVDGYVATYKWTKASGPGATMANSSTKTVTLTNITSTGTLTLNVTVTDNLGVTATDQVKLFVTATANQAPTVTACADQNVTLPVSQVNLSSTAADADGSISGYTWTKTSGPAATLTNASSSTLSVSNLEPGTYAFKVTVTDNQNATATDQVTLVVNAAPNQAPVVHAGADQTITLPVNQVTLTGTASDADGSITSYSWAQSSGPAATLGAVSTPSLSVSDLVAGVYSFTLTVTDNKGATATDQVSVVVNPAPVNQAPVVEAGEKITITLPTNSASFTAIASDVDGSIASYTWKKIGGSNTITMVGASTATLSVSNVISGTYVFRVEVSDNNGLKAADTVRLKVNGAVTTTTTTATTTTFASTEATGEYQLTLGQNYPNPVTSSTTTIPFTVDFDQHVVIKLYTSTGYEVATILDGQMSAGGHEVVFNVDSIRSSQSTANSVFYYKLIANGKVITKQMAIL